MVISMRPPQPKGWAFFFCLLSAWHLLRKVQSSYHRTNKSYGGRIPSGILLGDWYPMTCPPAAPSRCAAALVRICERPSKLKLSPEDWHPVFGGAVHRDTLKPWELFCLSTGQTLRLTMTPMDKHYNSHNPTFPYRGEVAGFHPGEACA